MELLSGVGGERPAVSAAAFPETVFFYAFALSARFRLAPLKL